MKISKRITLISYILQTVLFVTIIALNATFNITDTTAYIVSFVVVNLICIGVMHKFFLREISPDIYDNLHTEYPYINHFKFLKHACFSEDKLTRNLLRFQYLFILIGFAEFILLNIFS